MTVQMTEHVQLLILCFMVALIVNHVAHRRKGIERGRYAVIAVGAVSGFAGFLISLMLLDVIPMHWIVIGALVSGGYAYFMADAKGFNGIK